MGKALETAFAILGLFVVIYTLTTGEIPHLFPRQEARP